jgi:TPP-dependent pyruvate/acetoin dehydrogenase alpha subunit
MSDSATSAARLGDLADPRRFREPLEVSGHEPERLEGMLRSMLLIRSVEECIAELVASGEARCPCHLAIGQEGCAVGVAGELDPSIDRFFGAHRSHGHYLAAGGDPWALLAEVLGKSSGCSGGLGGSMHLIAPETGLLGTVPIVAATIPVAAGAALAARLDGRGGVVVSFFGDGATEEGVFHETLNLAALHRLPLLLVCENNLFSSHLHISLRQPSDRVARFAAAHLIPHETLDGNDVLAVAAAARRGLERGRAGEGPTFLELVTYRWRGHVGHREDRDVGVARAGDLPEWKERDPVQRLRRGMIAAGLLSDKEADRLAAGVTEEVAAALEKARRAPYPEPGTLEQAVLAPPRP